MTGREAAASLRRIAAAIEKFDRVPDLSNPMMDTDQQIGAAALLKYLRDLFTVAKKEIFSRGEILVILSEISDDRDIFHADLMALLDEEDEEEVQI